MQSDRSVGLVRPLLFLAATALLAGACTDDTTGTGESSQSVVINNKLSTNRLASNRLASNRLEADLQTVGDLLATAEGQEVLSYIVSCALPEGVTLTAPDPLDPMNTLEFFGAVGLAPHWADHALDTKGKRWVSACLFARVNANNVTVPISMRGPHASLATTDEERTDYTQQEGAFYGDYFRPATQPILWIACRGEAQAHGESGGLVDRDCTEPDPAHPGLTMCGFTYAGDCGDYDPPKSAHACGHFSSKGYWVSCKNTDAFPRAHHDHFSDDADDGDHDHDDDNDDHDSDHHGGHDWHDGAGAGRSVFHQVITTFVTP